MDEKIYTFKFGHKEFSGTRLQFEMLIYEIDNHLAFEIEHLSDKKKAMIRDSVVKCLEQ